MNFKILKKDYEIISKNFFRVQNQTSDYIDFKETGLDNTNKYDKELNIENQNKTFNK